MAERILIVDDDVDSLKLIGLMLQRNGYDVIVANSGNQALIKAEAEVPDLVILDVMMPDMNGLEVCRRLRANPTTNEIPIIMFTAKTLIDDKVKGFEAGADDYLTKPTHPAELTSRVRAILARNAAKKQAAAAPSKTTQRTVIGLLGVKGGAGVTTAVVNLSISLMQIDLAPIVLDFQLGTSGMSDMLGARTAGMAKLIQNVRITAGDVESEIVQHSSGLRFVPSSADPQEAQIAFKPDQAAQIVKAARELGDPTIIDMGHGLHRTNRRLLQEIDQLLLIIEPNPLALEMAKPMIKVIEDRIGSGRLNLIVLNRTQSSLQTSWQEIESTLERDVKGMISAAPELSFQALKNKKPMVTMQTGSVVAGQYKKLAEFVKTTVRSVKQPS